MRDAMSAQILVRHLFEGGLHHGAGHAPEHVVSDDIVHASAEQVCAEQPRKESHDRRRSRASHAHRSPSRRGSLGMEAYALRVAPGHVRGWRDVAREVAQRTKSLEALATRGDPSHARMRGVPKNTQDVHRRWPALTRPPMWSPLRSRRAIRSLRAWMRCQRRPRVESRDRRP